MQGTEYRTIKRLMLPSPSERFDLFIKYPFICINFRLPHSKEKAPYRVPCLAAAVSLSIVTQMPHIVNSAFKDIDMAKKPHFYRDFTSEPRALRAPRFAKE